MRKRYARRLLPPTPAQPARHADMMARAARRRHYARAPLSAAAIIIFFLSLPPCHYADAITPRGEDMMIRYRPKIRPMARGHVAMPPKIAQDAICERSARQRVAAFTHTPRQRRCRYARRHAAPRRHAAAAAFAAMPPSPRSERDVYAPLMARESGAYRARAT